MTAIIIIIIIIYLALRQLLQICYSKKVPGARVRTGDAEYKEEACITVEDIGATLEVKLFEIFIYVLKGRHM